MMTTSLMMPKVMMMTMLRSYDLALMMVTTVMMPKMLGTLLLP
jgi:hypothetical protein